MMKQKNNALIDRIVSTTNVRAADLLANPFNFRIHSALQKTTVGTSLRDIGWVRHVLVNQRSGHMVDGHLRVMLTLSEDEDAIVPVDYLDLNEAEEAYLLSMLDMSTGMAIVDRSKQQQLIDRIQSDSSAHDLLVAYTEAVGSRKGNLYGAAVTADEREALIDTIMNDDRLAEDAAEGGKNGTGPNIHNPDMQLHETIFVLSKSQMDEFNVIMKDIRSVTGLNASRSVFIPVKEWYEKQIKGQNNKKRK